jgi:hypothetical protein
VVLSSILVACAPAADPEPTSSGTVLTGTVAYDPATTGATWTYLPNGATLEDAPVVITALGPTVLDGSVREAWRMTGRGFDVTWFRERGPGGRYLVREERPGTEIVFDPPILELPSTPLQVGDIWTGSTQATVTFPDAAPDNRTSTLRVDWSTTVVDRRTVSVPAGTFDAFVLNFVTRTFDDQGTVVEQLTQESWFVPYVGEVRTENALFLASSNVLDLPRAP